MKSEEILRSITPEVKKREIEKIQKIKLPAELQKWVREYEKAGGERDEFIWKWLYIMNKIFVCSSAQKKYLESLVEVKFLFNMFIVLLDDISEKKKGKRLLDKLLIIPFNKEEIKCGNLNKKEKEYFKFTIKIWNQIEKTIKKYPNYGEMKEVFDYDTTQLLVSVKYSHLICKYYHLINEDEYWMQFPWSMQIVIDFDIDLMCMPKLTDDELRAYRIIALNAQKMGRIGNWISTWERELKEKDFTSFVFPYILENNSFTLKELKSRSEDDIVKKVKDSKAENYLLEEWDECYNKISELIKFSQVVNVERILKTLEYLIFMHLISRGLK